MEERAVRIEAAAAQTGLTKRTIRYWEELGLLPPAARTEAGYRLYSAEDIARLERIRDLKRSVGLALGDIQVLLEAEAARADLRQRYRASSELAERQRTLAESIGVVERQLRLITSKREALAQLQVQYEDSLARLRQLQQQLTEEAATVS
ncbi:MAG: MerR family transcriptional regulator [Candidatus Dormibacteraeota bacterium]|nr:MerR family transcriptional regulator [Candidatus Dormibacteraeota bacterium]